jgi:5-oxoprolinase (ATP-hydrolysing)
MLLSIASLFLSSLILVSEKTTVVLAWTPNGRRINMSGKYHFCIDRGGTFTDVHCILPDGSQVVRKLLSEDPAHYTDAPREGIRRLLQEFSSEDYPRGVSVKTHEIGSIRMGTTVATNALLERDGERMALLITKGFKDLLEIGNQARPNIFDLTCAKPSLLYERVVEVDERIVLDEFFPKNDTHPLKVGITGEGVRIIKTPDLEQVKQDLQILLDEGITAVAIATMHSYVYPEHELQLGRLAESMGFTQVSLSSQVMPMVKIVSR